MQLRLILLLFGDFLSFILNLVSNGLFLRGNIFLPVFQVAVERIVRNEGASVQICGENERIFLRPLHHGVDFRLPT
jgi:hypothetical protein